MIPGTKSRLVYFSETGSIGTKVRRISHESGITDVRNSFFGGQSRCIWYHPPWKMGSITDAYEERFWIVFQQDCTT